MYIYSFPHVLGYELGAKCKFKFVSIVIVVVLFALWQQQQQQQQMGTTYVRSHVPLGNLLPSSSHICHCPCLLRLDSSSSSSSSCSCLHSIFIISFLLVVKTFKYLMRAVWCPNENFLSIFLINIQFAVIFTTIKSLSNFKVFSWVYWDEVSPRPAPPRNPTISKYLASANFDLL